MKAMTKIGLVTTSVLTIGTLTACQSTQTPKHDQKDRLITPRHDDRNLSHEQREQRQKMHAQRKEIREQIQKACDGKTIGQTVQIKTEERTIEGSCNMIFKADRQSMKNMKRGFRQDEQTNRIRYDRPRMKDLTEEQRVQIKQQFEQKRAEHKAQWEAVQKACTGQPDGKVIQVKLGDKILNGKCMIKFQPDFKIANNLPPLLPQT